MTLTVPLAAEQEAQLLALAQSKGIPADRLVRQAVLRLLDESHVAVAPRPAKKRSLGVLAHLGNAPSASEIDQARQEMFANFPREID
jgi:hypothetical protein